MKRCLPLAPVALLVACRLGGGPSADPDAYLTFDTGTEAAMDDPAPRIQADDAAVMPTEPDASVTPDDDGALPGDATGQDDARDESTPDPIVDGGNCSATVAVCDPVHNMGCNPLQQCDVDPAQTSTPTGFCLFNSGEVEGGACIMSIVSESCAPKQTCVGGTCRALCFCNADCPAGQCCSDTSGPHGFTLCRMCP